jgi:hypothetical protein
MIIEHRIYTVQHGGMENYLARYEKLGLPVAQRHLGRLLGFFVSDVGRLNQVLHIWAYDSMADREQRRAAMEADPEWQEFKKGNRGTFVEQQVTLWHAASFSPQRV